VSIKGTWLVEKIRNWGEESYCLCLEESDHEGKEEVEAWVRCGEAFALWMCCVRSFEAGVVVAAVAAAAAVEVVEVVGESLADCVGVADADVRSAVAV